LFLGFGYKVNVRFNFRSRQTQAGIQVSSADSGVRTKFSWWRFQNAKIFLCTKIESMIRKNIKQAAIQYVNVVKQL